MMEVLIITGGGVVVFCATIIVCELISRFRRK